MTYTDVFGSATLPPAEYGYASFTLTTNATFVWPYNTDGSSYPVAKVMDIACDAGNEVTLPDCTEVSTGEDFLIRNVGANVLIVKDAAGVQVASVAVGAASYFYLTDNTTAAGVFGVIGFGVGTSTADASSLVGYGIKAVGASLNQSHPVFPTSTGITLGNDHRSKLVVFTGGSDTFYLSAAAALGNDYFTLFRNEGTGTVTIDPAASELIDGMVSMQVQPGESLMLICTGTKWYSVGYGRSTLYQFTQLTKDVSVGGTITLSATEAANKLITFIGNPSTAVEVVVPAVVAVYYTQSAISTAQSITLKTSAGSGVGINQGTRVIALCDGTNVVSAQSAVANTSVSLTDGSVSVPSLFFATQTNTGLYKSGTQDLGVTINGSNVGTFGSTGLQTSTIGPNSTQRHTLPAVTSDTVALLAATQTLTNKTIALGSNTVSGTLAQFNTACTDADFATTADIGPVGSTTTFGPVTHDKPLAMFYYAAGIQAPRTKNTMAFDSTFTRLCVPMAVTVPYILGVDSYGTISSATITTGGAACNTVGSGGGYFVGVTSAGVIYYMLESLTTWSTATGSAGAVGYGGRRVEYDGTAYYVTNTAGNIYRSATTPTNFSLVYTGTSEAVSTQWLNSSLLVSVGASARIVTSPDGTTWTVRSNGSTTDFLADVVYVGGKYVAVGFDSTVKLLVVSSSTDGATWGRTTFDLSTFGVGINTTTPSGGFPRIGAIVDGTTLYVLLPGRTLVSTDSGATFPTHYASNVGSILRSAPIKGPAGTVFAALNNSALISVSKLTTFPDPAKWLPVDGRQLSRSTYPALLAVQRADRPVRSYPQFSQLTPTLSSASATITGRTMFSGSGTTCLALNGVVAYKSTDGGATWAATGTHTATTGTPAIFPQWNDGVAVLVSYGNTYHRYTFASNTWASVTPPAVSGTVTFDAGPNATVAMIGSTDSNVYYSNDYGATWLTVANPVGTGGTLFFTGGQYNLLGNSKWYVSNTGTSWVDTGRAVPSNVTTRLCGMFNGRLFDAYGRVFDPSGSGEAAESILQRVPAREYAYASPPLFHYREYNGLLFAFWFDNTGYTAGGTFFTPDGDTWYLADLPGGCTDLWGYTPAMSTTNYSAVAAPVVFGTVPSGPTGVIAWYGAVTASDSVSVPTVFSLPATGQGGYPVYVKHTA